MQSKLVERRLLSVGSLAVFLTVVACVKAGPIGQPSAPTHREGAQPPQPLILRIEAGAHTGRISQVALDRENRYLVTASSDKTVRVWELSTGRLIRTLRPPIGGGNEGKIFAAALSPDGTTVACGGYTGVLWDDTYTVYLFDRVSGRVAARITGLPASIARLAYSSDGRVLAIALHGRHGKNGIHVYRTKDNKLLLEDLSYGAESYGLAFDPSGRLVTSSYDGLIRLYGSDFRRILKQAPGGKRPFSVSFSPDGQKIAVGFEDSAQVNVLSAKDLSFLYAPAVKEGSVGAFSSVAWSADGRFLYAGGTYRADGTHLVRKWENEGKGTSADLSAANNTILDLVAIEDGGVVYGAAGAAFGTLDTKGTPPLARSLAVPDHRDNREGFLLAADGTVVQFGYEQWGKKPAHFSIHNRVLSKGQSVDTLKRPRGAAPGLVVEGWSDAIISTATSPLTINGRPIRLDPHEIARSYAVAPDDRTVLVGTPWYLRLLDAEGKHIWRTPVPGDAWAVNIAANGKVAVAALGDGTIRWYRMSDGQEVLALFAHPDRRRWVIWTPSGYYDAAPGAEELIGWHKNYGADAAADFFPVSHFRTVSYRPDVVANMVNVWDESEALRLASAEARSLVDGRIASESERVQVADMQAKVEKEFAKYLLGLDTKAAEKPGAQPEAKSERDDWEGAILKDLPPRVILFSPRDGATVSSPTITVRYAVVTPSAAPVTEVSAFVDGKPVQTPRRIQDVGKAPSGQAISELLVPVPQRECEISIQAKHRWARSKPTTVRVKWRNPLEHGVVGVQPKLFVLAVGVSQDKKATFSLRFPAKDAQAFAEAFQGQANGRYRDVAVKVLTESKATKDNILDGLDWIDRHTTEKDVGMIFLAGHAVTDQRGSPYFLAVDSDTERLRRTGLAFSDITNTVASLAGKTLLFIDTCQPGAPSGTADCTGQINALVGGLSSGAQNNTVVFAASSGSQPALTEPSWNHSPFAKALLDGVQGKADYRGTGSITVSMLDLYLSERVKALTRGQQRPATIKPASIQDFILAYTHAAPSPPSPLPVDPEERPPVGKQPLNQILQRLPPVVTILSPQEGTVVSSQDLTIRYTVRTPSGDAVTEVMALIDGRPMPTARGIAVVGNAPSGQKVHELHLRAPRRDFIVSLIAKSRWATSEPSTVRIRWQGAANGAQPARKPTLYVLAVGISHYGNPPPRLQLAHKDARDFAAALESQAGGLYEKVVVRELTDDQATKNNILDAFDWIERSTTSRDVAMILLAGHGVNDKGGTYYFLPVNADTERLRRTGLPFSDIKNAVAGIDGKILLFVDTCHAGNIMGTRRGAADINAVVNELTSAENGVVVFASSTGRQYALEDPAWNNGAFTKALVEGFSGEADHRGTGRVTVNMLDLYLSERVKELTEGKQTPTTTKPHTIQDFPIAVMQAA